MRQVAVCLILLVLTATAVRAADPTKEEEQFLKSLVDALGAESADVRDATEEALVRMGDPAAAHFVTNVKKVDRDLLPVVTRILIRIGYPALQRVKLLEKLPTGVQGEALLAVVKALSGEGGAGGFGDPDPDLAAKVEEIMATVSSDSFAPGNPAVEKLVALGRPAIPAIVPYMNPARGTWTGFVDAAAAAALGRLCTREDVPKLCALLDQGWTKAAAVLTDLNDPSCVPALVRALQANRMSHDVGRAIAKFRDQSTRAPIIRFLGERGAAFPPGCSALLDALVEFRATEAIPVLKRIAKETGGDEMNRNTRLVYTCGALVRLGDPAGFPPLFGALTMTGTDEWLVFWAGDTLNTVTGQTFWGQSGGGEKTRHDYEAWYSRVKGRLEWNEAMRRFDVRE
jgi:HEAT repeat protein